MKILTFLNSLIREILKIDFFQLTIAKLLLLVNRYFATGLLSSNLKERTSHLCNLDIKVRYLHKTIKPGMVSRVDTEILRLQNFAKLLFCISRNIRQNFAIFCEILRNESVKIRHNFGKYCTTKYCRQLLYIAYNL